jgi:hypothetical protein
MIQHIIADTEPVFKPGSLLTRDDILSVSPHAHYPRFKHGTHHFPDGIFGANTLNVPHQVPDLLTSYFWSGDAIRSRRVSDIVLTGTVDVPVPPARLLADWEREISSRLALEPGDVEAMPLARARARWPDYTRCVQAVSDWTCALGLPGVQASSDVALMACRGAKYHHDGGQYGSAAFCNLFLSEDRGLDLHFPSMDYRIPLTRGTVVIFDTGQPHGVIQRGSSGFNVADLGASHRRCPCRART